ncbi:MAG: hypothetical protein CK604_07120 [Curvibacter sp. PD_MW3]|nr:MAG: hypothetical protein CK604_07120 [Curvibacter sp. PD_MW3]
MSAELATFVKAIGLERAAPGRYSLLLSLGLFGGHLAGRLNPAKVIREIEALEGVGAPSRLKPPIQNRHPPLKGLWHKHHLQDGLGSLAKNLRRSLHKYGMPYLEQQIQEAERLGEERYITPDMVGALVDDAVLGNLRRLSEDRSITGEWLLYAKYEGKNYYLCLTSHDASQHDELRKQIDLVCCREFSFLTDLLSDASRD